MYIARQLSIEFVVSDLMCKEDDKEKFNYYFRLVDKIHRDKDFALLLERNLEAMCGGGGYPSLEMVQDAIRNPLNNIYKILKNAGIIDGE